MTGACGKGARELGWKVMGLLQTSIVLVNRPAQYVSPSRAPAGLLGVQVQQRLGRQQQDLGLLRSARGLRLEVRVGQGQQLEEGGGEGHGVLEGAALAGAQQLVVGEAAQGVHRGRAWGLRVRRGRLYG